MIIDDEYHFAKSVKTFLEKHGFQALVATNGEQAMDLVEEEKPNLIILDIRMPGMNGYEVLQKVKWMNEKMSIIITSAIDVPDMEEKLMHSGAHAVFRKPVDLNVLRESIRKLISE